MLTECLPAYGICAHCTSDHRLRPAQRNFFKYMATILIVQLSCIIIYAMSLQCQLSQCLPYILSDSAVFAGTFIVAISS